MRIMKKDEKKLKSCVKLSCRTKCFIKHDFFVFLLFFAFQVA